MTYFDSSLESDPIEEQQTDPVLPEERHVFELIGFERSEPDQFRKDGGVKWSWRVFEEDGRTPFVFQDEQYIFWRTTNIDKKTRKPLFSVGTFANDWASALLGRPLGVDAQFSVSELRGKRMSAMVVWKPQKSDPKKKTIQLASLRHVFTGADTTSQGPSPSPTPSRAPASQVTADATDDDIDRALMIAKFEKKLERAKKRKLPSLKKFQEAYATFNTATADEIEVVTESLDDAIDAMDD